jgi:hypothetical protein
MGGKVAAHAGKADVVWGDDDPWMRLGGWRLGIRFFTALWCVREVGLPSIFFNWQHNSVVQQLRLAAPIFLFFYAKKDNSRY